MQRRGKAAGKSYEELPLSMRGEKRVQMPGSKKIRNACASIDA
jgi:hypothetical protein